MKQSEEYFLGEDGIIAPNEIRYVKLNLIHLTHTPALLGFYSPKRRECFTYSGVIDKKFPFPIQ